MGRFLLIGDDELQRARLRVNLPEWRPAAESLRHEADKLLAADEPLPQFDCSWYDIDPDRNYADTYAQYHDYVRPLNQLLSAVGVLLRAGAVFQDDHCLDRAKAWTLHVADHCRFHVKHYDSGMEYARSIISLAEAYNVLGERLSDDERGRVARSMTECGEAIRWSTRHWLTDPGLAAMPYNNHFAFHHYGQLALALVLDRQDWIDEVLDGPRNFGEMLVGSTRDDGLCYESSTHYHFATLYGLMVLAELVRHCPRLGRDLYRLTCANGRMLKQMFDAPLGLLLPNGELPPVGDCYADRRPLAARSGQFYEVAFVVYGDPRYSWLLQQGGPRASAAALFCGADRLEPAEPPLGRSRLWIEHGYALLTSRCGRGYWESEALGRPVGMVAFLAGDLSGIHHHNDAMSLQVAAGGQLWTEDVESRAVESHGFSASIQKAFNRTVMAHNTVVVDGRDRTTLRRPVPVTEFKELPGCRTVTMTDLEGRLYSGVRMARGVAVTPEYCLDLFQAASDAEHTYDWLVHPRSDGPAECGLAFAEAAYPTEPGMAGHAVLRDVGAAMVDDGRLSLAWKQGDLTFRADVSAGCGGTVTRGRWPVTGDWSDGGREMFVLGVRSQRADFIALYQLDGAALSWCVEDVVRFNDGLNDLVRIVVTDGAERREHLLTLV
ncbi:MAG: alginate lyase family protein [Planctomycetes bacterium]|nr:alginate lyase family protein [Planctomycetota bacterium]